MKLFTIVAISLLFCFCPAFADDDVCDDLGDDNLKRLRFAYCKIMDCGSDPPNASPRACIKAYDRYVELSGGEDPPCGPPDHEDVCEDVEGRSAYSLCHWYCDKGDCDSDDPRWSERRCKQLRNAYARHTGGEAPPCDGCQSGEQCEYEFGPDTKWWWFDNASESDLVEQLDAGFRLVDLEIVQVNPIRFAAVLVRNRGVYAKKWFWVYDRTEAQIRDLAVEIEARPIRIQPYSSPEGLRFAAIMVRETRQDNTNWTWLSNTTVEVIREHVYENNARAIDVEAYRFGTEQRYSAILDNALTGGANEILTHLQASSIDAWLSDNPEFKLVDLERLPWGGWIAIAARDPGLTYWWWYLDVTPDDIMHLTARHYARIVDIEARQTDTGLRYDIVMTDNGLPQQGVGVNFYARNEYDSRLRAFMKRHDIPGLGMALVKEGRLVYAQSYGHARANLAVAEEATVQTLFRIGSCSKITAAIAMIQLIEQGVQTPAGQPVTMDTYIFHDILKGPTGVGWPLGKYNTELNNITVGQVLKHIAGFDGNPIVETETIAIALGIQSTPTCAETVRWMLDKSIAHTPGTFWFYYNTGPSIISAAVEVLSGQTFENYIRDNLFAPYGIQNLVVPSADLFAERAVGEAEHYRTIFDRLNGLQIVKPKYLELVPAWPGGVPDYGDIMVRFPYGGIPLVNGTAPGGIAATPAAYARFLAGIDGSDGNPLISQNAFDNMLTQTSRIKPTYGAFVSVNPYNGDVFHNGKVGGGHGWYVIKTADDVIWTVFANTSTSDEVINELNSIMIAAYNAAKPAIDASMHDHFPSLGIVPVSP